VLFLKHGKRKGKMRKSSLEEDGRERMGEE